MLRKAESNTDSNDTQSGDELNKSSEIKNEDVDASSNDSDDENDVFSLIDMLAGLDENPDLSQEEAIANLHANLSSFFKKAGLFAAGPIGDAHFSEHEITLRDLINETVSLSSEKNFTETNEEYVAVLNKIESHLTDHPESINYQDTNFKVTPMHTAGGAGLFELVKVLLKFNPDLTKTNCFNETAAERARGYAGRDDIADHIENISKKLTL